MVRLILCIAMAGAAWAQPKSSLELFLLIGQSNMAGRGVPEAQDKEAIAGIWTLDKELQWTPAIDPLHSDRPTAGVGIGRSFARALRALNPQAEIGLIPAAFGGSSLDEWAPGGKHFTNAVARAKAAAGQGRLRAILWHQGEADSAKEEKADSYAGRWTAFIQALRKEVGDVPVVTGQLGEFFGHKVDQFSFAGKVNQNLATLAVKVPRVAFVPSFGLKHKGDDVHFDSPSLREFGRRYAMAYLLLDPEWIPSK